ncbi:MAG: helix-turn-helix domain-containing protein [Alphaproteobacteria bacterium]|nr:helix-turn-helix domain-containing protein [Alphaproteobacteria bacterium]MBQ8729490.1 helix-turn-helix domain-containing protein [Alphaproteobacteria bacterium]
MAGKIYTPTFIDEHIGRRIQLRRNMLGLSQKDLADACGVTFQQIQKYETAGNRVAASRLFEIGMAMDTPVSFFFMGLPGNLPDETKTTRSQPVMRVCSQAADDPMGKNETLELIKLYWKLSDDGKREAVLNLLKTMNSME